MGNVPSESAGAGRNRQGKAVSRRPKDRQLELGTSGLGRNLMNIGAIGAGGMGAVLARRLVLLGHHVLIANSRGPQSLAALAAEIGATPASVVDAARAGEIVIIAIPTKAVTHLPPGLFTNLADGVIVVD